LQSWHGIISSSLASLLLLGISTLIAIALAIHTELMPKKYLQIGSKPASPTKRRLKREQERERERERDRDRERDRELDSLSNITQIRAQSPLGATTGSTTITTTTSSSNPGQRRPPPSSTAGMRGAIGISWLLPLLFAVAAPLICSIIGQWPRHWWLEVLWTGSASPEAGVGKDEAGDSDSGAFYSAHSLLNGDNLLLESEAVMGNGTSSPPTETSSASSSSSSTGRAVDDDVATSTSSITSIGSASNSGFSASWSGITSFSTSSSTTSSTSTSVAALAAPLTSGPGDSSATPSPSLSFILFVCIDLLFILLFFALFAILMKKLLWLWHKNRNVHTHPLDKFNLALSRR